MQIAKSLEVTEVEEVTEALLYSEMHPVVQQARYALIALHISVARIPSIEHATLPMDLIEAWK